MRISTPHRRKDVLIKTNTIYGSVYRKPSSNDHDLMIWILRKNGKSMTYGKLLSEMRRIKALQLKGRLPMTKQKDVVIGVGTPKGTGQSNPKEVKK